MNQRRRSARAGPTPRGANGVLPVALRALAGLVALVALVSLGVGVVVGVVDGQPAAAERVWHVAPWGNDAAAGTFDDPLATAGEAVDRSSSGDTIELRGGVYHESVEVIGVGVTIRSRDGERAVFDGAVPVEGFRPVGDRWVHDRWTRQFVREPSGGPVGSDHIVAGYPDQVFVDGRQLDQVLRLVDVGPGTFFHDTDADQLWLGDDPSASLVEASRATFAFEFRSAGGSLLENVTVRRFATEARDMAAVRAYTDDMTIRGVEVASNARMGLSVIGEGVRITDSRFVDNGYLGVHAERASSFVLERSAVLRNNREDFDPFHSGAGIKITRSEGVTIRESDISRNRGPGVWTDLDTRRVTIVRNLIEGNRRAGVEVELSSDVNVLSNVSIDNGEAGIWILESQNVQVLHNATFGNVNGIEVEEGPRREVRNVRIMNNAVGDPAPGTRALLDVNDWTGERPADAMGVSVDYNAYWFTPDQRDEHLSRWGQWPDGLVLTDDLTQHQRSTGQGWNSLVQRGDDNPFARAPSRGDYRGDDWLRAGAPVTGSAAAELGMVEGDRRRIGPVAPVERRRTASVVVSGG